MICSHKILRVGTRIQTPLRTEFGSLPFFGHPWADFSASLFFPQVTSSEIGYFFNLTWVKLSWFNSTLTWVGYSTHLRELLNIWAIEIVYNRYEVHSYFLNLAPEAVITYSIFTLAVVEYYLIICTTIEGLYCIILCWWLRVQGHVVKWMGFSAPDSTCLESHSHIKKRVVSDSLLPGTGNTEVVPSSTVL